MSTETAVLNELLEPVGECLTMDGARKLVELRATPSAQARLETLAAKSSSGDLTKEEQAEYDALVSAGTFIAVLQSKARRLLKHHESP